MTWGDSHYMGLTGLEVVGKDGESLPLDLSMMAASPMDLNDLPEYRNDLRTLDKYVWDQIFCMNLGKIIIKSVLKITIGSNHYCISRKFWVFFLLPRLIDGHNITTDDQHMWLIPFSYGEPHTLNIIFNKAQTIAGLRIWNYNKSPEDSYRGVGQ